MQQHDRGAFARAPRAHTVRAAHITARAVTAALGVPAVDAIDLVAGEHEARIRASDDRGLRFVDISPEHNRQWCSMSRRGNRAKARARYARRTAR